MKSNIPKATKPEQKTQKQKPQNPVMAKIPDEMKNMGKLTAVIQLIGFLIVFLAIYLLLRRFVQSLPLRILILIGDYIVTALFSYIFVRPAAQKLENKIKKNSKHPQPRKK
ncbi:MAG: hypothetical protein IK134_12120 [Oscillospiraceae bacterium]|nr:hypothetical protein [Oscillospiraceae bacterium]MBR5364056.1 hypothetical protein [Oscillospiraceae bacterium]